MFSTLETKELATEHVLWFSSPILNFSRNILPRVAVCFLSYFNASHNFYFIEVCSLQAEFCAELMLLISIFLVFFCHQHFWM